MFSMVKYLLTVVTNENKYRFFYMCAFFFPHFSQNCTKIVECLKLPIKVSSLISKMTYLGEIKRIES